MITQSARSTARDSAAEQSARVESLSDVLAPVGVGKGDAAEDMRIDDTNKDISRTYAKTFISSIAVALIGFAISIFLRVVMNTWLGPVHVIHTFLAIMYMLAMLAQITFGALQRGRDAVRAAHRVNGRYVLPCIYMTMVISGVVVVVNRLLRIKANTVKGITHDDVLAAYLLLSRGAFDLFAFSIVILMAKRKDFATHKDFVGLVVLSIVEDGLYRLVLAGLHNIASCDGQLTNTKKAVGHVLNRFLTLLVIMPA